MKEGAHAEIKNLRLLFIFGQFTQKITDFPQLFSGVQSLFKRRVYVTLLISFSEEPACSLHERKKVIRSEIPRFSKAYVESIGSSLVSYTLNQNLPDLRTLRLCEGFVER